MMLWDLIRDWFVEHIWGGIASNGDYFSGVIGDVTVTDAVGEVDGATMSTTAPFIKIGSGYFPDVFNGDNGGRFTDAFISLGDWLSTTSTIIVLCALCFFFFLMVRWLFRLTAGLIQGRG